jgi:hypothetical protein
MKALDGLFAQKWISESWLYVVSSVFLMLIFLASRIIVSYPTKLMTRFGSRMGHSSSPLDTKCFFMALRYRHRRQPHIQRRYSSMSRGRMDPWKIIIHKCSFSVCYGVGGLILGSTSSNRFIDKVELVKEIIVNLARDIEKHTDNRRKDEWTSIPTERFLTKNKRTAYVSHIPIQSQCSVHYQKCRLLHTENDTQCCSMVQSKRLSRCSHIAILEN